MTAPSPRASAGYVPWWLLALVTVLFMILALALVGFVMLTRPADLPSPTATVMILTAQPAGGSAPTATLQSPPTPTQAASATPPPPPAPAGELKIGDYVQVVGTGDSGFLNLRAEPSLSAAVNYLALEREVLQVQAGPQQASEFVWWYLVDPATNTRFGWAVQNYLQVVQGP